MTDVLTHGEFGGVLREWRTRRGRSQLALAGEAGVSQRHISFLETGRSNPSREMVIHLGLVLDMSLRDRNAALLAAGYAPVYTERQIDDPDLADIRRALELMLGAHEPCPAYVIDGHWNLVMANEAASRFVAGFPPAAQELSGNLLRATMHPDGLRHVIENWHAVAAAMLRRVEREVAEAPADLELMALYEEMRSYPGTPSDRHMVDSPNVHDLLMPFNMELGGHRLSLFTTIATLGSPTDITLEQLRLETLLPANAETEAGLRTLAGMT